MRYNAKPPHPFKLVVHKTPVIPYCPAGLLLFEKYSAWCIPLHPLVCRSGILSKSNYPTTPSQTVAKHADTQAYLVATKIRPLEESGLPALFPSKSLVKKCQNLGDIKLHVFQIKIFLTVLLHLEQVVQLEIEFKKPTIATCATLAYSGHSVLQVNIPL